MSSNSNNSIEAIFDSLPPQWSRVFAVLLRTLVWCLLFALLYLLRSFFLLLFLTFVFAYLQSSAEETVGERVSSRRLRVSLVGLGFLGILIAVGWLVIPRVIEQAQTFAANYKSYLSSVDEHIVALGETYPVLRSVLAPQPESMLGRDPATNKSPTVMLIHHLLGAGEAGEGGDSVGYTIEVLRNIGGPLLSIGSAFILSLLFSFLIVLDLPRLGESVRELANSKLGFIYDEVSGSIRDFAEILGHSLQAQVIIAIINTILTSLVILILGVGSKLAFLSLVVFVCGFIPVAGVLLSSVPILLLTLQHSGVSGVLLGALLIWMVHLTEAYILNPKIFGKRLRINPVLVLIILTVAGKLFHMWGLVLGLPVCSYFFAHAIRYRD